MATEAELAILLRLHDELSGKMGTPTKAVDNFGLSLKRVQEFALGQLGADSIKQGLTTITNFIKGSVAAGEESIRVNQQLKSVIESTGGSAGVSAKSVQDMASALQLQTKFSDEAIISADNLLLTFTNIKANIFPQATKTVLDMSVALGQDLKSSAIQLGKALNDPITGITALRRVGVSFNETQVETIKNLVATGQGLEAQKMILAELNKEFGGSAENLTGFEKKLRAVQVAIDEGKESFGKFIIGGLTLLSDWITDHKADFEEWWGRIKPVLQVFQDYAEARIAGVIDFFKDLVNTIGKAVDFIDDVIHGKWQQAWQDLKDIASSILGLLVDELASAFGTIPNLLISAINEAISAANSINFPKISAKILGVGPSFGGGSLGIPSIPSIPLPQADIASFFNHVSAAAQEAGPKVNAFAGAAADFGSKAESGGKKAEDAAKKLEDAMLKMRDSIDSALDDSIVSFQEFTSINKQALKDGLEPLTAAFAGHLEASKLLALATNGSAEDAFNLTKNLTKMQDVLKTSGVEAVKLGVTFAQDVVGKIKTAFSSLFGAPTKEEATLDLQIAEVQRRIAGFSAAAGGQDITNALAPDNALLASLQKQRDLMSANNDVLQKQFVLSNAELLTNTVRDQQARQLIEDQRQTSTWVAQVTTDFQRMSPEVQGITTAMSNFRQYLGTLMQGGSNDLGLASRGV